MDEAACPGCGDGLDVALGDGGRHYECKNCGAVVAGIGILRKELADGTAQGIWAAAEAAPAAAGPPCPFCRSAMRAAPLDSGHAAICLTCQMVWLDRAALTALPAARSAPQPAASTALAGVRCENCGAPVSATWDERCRYCGAVLKAPASVVVVPVVQDFTQHSGGGFGGLLGGLADLVD